MDKTGFQIPKQSGTNWKKVPAFAVRGEFLRKHYANRLKNGSSILPDESEHLYLKALMAN